MWASGAGVHGFQASDLKFGAPCVHSCACGSCDVCVASSASASCGAAVFGADVCPAASGSLEECPAGCDSASWDSAPGGWAKCGSAGCGSEACSPVERGSARYGSEKNGFTKARSGKRNRNRGGPSEGTASPPVNPQNTARSSG